MKPSFPASAAALLLAGSALLPQGPRAAAGLGQEWLLAHDGEARALLGRMTLEEKIGQMTQPDQEALKDERDIETYFLGSVLSGGNSDPKTNSLADWTEMVERYQAHTQKTRLRVPLLYGVDAVHGHNNVLGAVIFQIGRASCRERVCTLV